MHRSAPTAPIATTFGERIFPDPALLPLPVYRDFISMLYGMRFPIFGLGAVFVGICLLVGRHLGSDFLIALAALGALTTLARLATIRSFHRAAPILRFEELRRWERWYAAGNLASAALLALLNIVVMAEHDPLVHLITVSLVFGFGAGIVSRTSVRPAICIAGLLVATVPTVAGLAFHAANPDRAWLHSELFLVEAVIVAAIMDCEVADFMRDHFFPRRGFECIAHQNEAECSIENADRSGQSRIVRIELFDRQFTLFDCALDHLSSVQFGEAWVDFEAKFGRRSPDGVEIFHLFCQRQPLLTQLCAHRRHSYCVCEGYLGKSLRGLARSILRIRQGRLEIQESEQGPGLDPQIVRKIADEDEGDRGCIDHPAADLSQNCDRKIELLGKTLQFMRGLALEGIANSSPLPKARQISSR